MKKRHLQQSSLFLCALLLICICIGAFSSLKPAAPPAAVPAGAETGGQPTVYLTFDDGPSKVTGDILDYLAEEEVPATFFVIGIDTDRGKTLLRRMVQEGHAVGLHTYSHVYSEIYDSPDAFFADQKKLRDYLKGVIGYSPAIFRFPGGSNNYTAEGWVLDGICAEAQKEGLVWFDWNAVAEDSGSTAAPPGEMAENIIQSGGDKERIIILMHDNSIRTTAVDCLRIIIPYYKEKGYQFKTLTPNTELNQFNKVE